MSHRTTAGSETLRGFELTVSKVQRETADAVSITFDVTPDLQSEFEHRAGQFLTIAVPGDRVPHVARCYSLSSAPGSGTTITVKRIDGGYASGWLTSHVAEGGSLRVLPPSGAFTVSDPSRDIALAGAGSGITPIMSILRWILETGTGRVALFYANRDLASTIFASTLDSLAKAHPDRLSITHWREDEQGLPTSRAIAEWAADLPAGDVWTCGPAPFMDAVAAAVPQRHVHREAYRSLVNDPFAVEETDAEAVAAVDADESAPHVEVEIDGKVHNVAWPRDRDLVEVLLAHDIDVPHACREGWCGSCTCRLEEGTVDMATNEALEDDDLDDGYVLGCQSRPTCDRLRVVFD